VQNIFVTLAIRDIFDLTKPRILLIEGKRTDHPSFAAGLTKKSYLVESVPSGAAALNQLDHVVPNLIVVDASSMRTSGKRICKALREKQPGLPLILVIDRNSDPNDDYGADIVLLLPFTMQKLINRIRHLLPIQNNCDIKAGPIMLDVAEKRALVNGKQVQLTPRLVVILKILMEHAGAVVERKAMFSEAWETDYTADTRSLDVHMSWLRHVIEENPRKPQFIKTVRGIGYRLDVEKPQKPKIKKVKTP
jgi:DNA-binding response OmpR family regulator